MDPLIHLYMSLLIDKLLIITKFKDKSLFLKLQLKKDQNNPNILNMIMENLFYKFQLKNTRNWWLLTNKLKIIMKLVLKEEMNMLNLLNILYIYRFITKNLDLKKISNNPKLRLMLMVSFSPLVKIMISEPLIHPLILWDLSEKLMLIFWEEDVVKKLVLLLKNLKSKISQDLKEVTN